MRTAPLIALLLLGAGCGPSTTTITMKEDNNSGQNGTAVLTQEGDTLVVDVTLARGNANGPQIGHIHRGKCGALGDPVAQLESVVDGKSRTEIVDEDVTLETVLAAPHAVNIHSHDDVSVYVSCGDIR